MQLVELKGIVHPKIKILSLCTHPQLTPNLYEFFFFPVEHKISYFEEEINLYRVERT